MDLAGSEKIDDEDNADRINEAKYINKSLSALGNVIYTLKNKQMLMNKQANTSISSMKTAKSNMHIPYRDSKLTHIMKGCLRGGDSLTHLIVCVSPCINSLQEIISSMKFA